MPVFIDPRHHDAVIFEVDDPVADEVALSASQGDLARRLTAAGIGVGCAESAMLRETARRLGVHPGRCVVVAGGEAGVRTARAGGFALIVGIDRAERAEDLRSCGADVVVPDLVAVTVRDGYRRMSELADALQSYGEIVPLAETRTPVVLLDFDGTLSDIVGDPDTAALVPGARSVLDALAARCPVAVVSGRALADIRDRIGVPGIWYAGSHGFELCSPDGGIQENEAGLEIVRVLAGALAEVRERVGAVDGVLIEDKRFSIAVHYRNVAAESVDEVVTAVRNIAQCNGLRADGGRRVVELKPDTGWHKGRAVEWILDRIDGDELLLPVYIGDDLTDEDGFDAVRLRGIGVAVRSAESGDRRSAARFALDSPAAVCAFLARLSDQLAVEQDLTNDPWTLTFGGYLPEDERLREALCTLGNGYLATRGAAPECDASRLHYPATYVAGIYNRLFDEIAGTTVDNESLVNLPNWLPVTFRVDGGAWFDIDAVEFTSYVTTLDLRRATLTREFVMRDQAGRITRIRQRRLVAMHRPHVAAMATTVRAENWSGRLQLRSVLDGGVENLGVERYRALSSRHLTVDAMRELSRDAVLLQTHTGESQIQIAVAARHRVTGGEPESVDQRVFRDDCRIGHDIEVVVTAGQAVTLEKVIAVYTGRDHGMSGPVTAAEREIAGADTFDRLEDGHRLAWAHLWERFNIDMGHDPNLLRLVRLHQLHLLQTLSPHTADLDVGVPARGLHGEAYRGHVFWDELFVFPVLNMRLPKVTRSLLLYRYRRLPEARRAAAEAGYAGAMFPWQSGSDGREESQRLHLNPRSGRWNPDASARAHHVGLAIAFNIWQHYQVTGDIGFLIDYGAEMLVEITKFWVSAANLDPHRDRYVIRGVIGPDEFHSGYPGREYDGVDNNAYTNLMAVWVIVRTLEALERLPLSYRLALLETVGVGDEDLAHWEDVSRRMFVPFHDGVITQFEGYDRLRELDWEAYRNRYDDLQRLDRILEAEGDSVNNYRAGKQADTLMLFYLLSADELYELFDRLGYNFAPEQIPATIDYYQKRTSHGSTLSAVVHSWVLARGDRREAMHYFRRVLASDVVDIQRGTTAEGIHLAAMAGSIDLLQRCFTGLELRRDRIVVGPMWPEPLGRLAFTFRYRGHRLRLTVLGRSSTLSAEPSEASPILVECRGQAQTLVAGGTVEFTR
ncbi:MULTISPECIES: trehalose-phosphatase [Mycolicibacterium]|uniref:Trehalose 6-phosphatase n=2 Tax=Mycolicibacterium gilvum TaxID=1804 RepID=E6TE54_MYCSR|nr:MULTISPECIES: trehalose-phosphatase [Mycolicibacterium]ABP47455.1 trehalose 6-phosphatase [Mycolicibacterium gilvum PYR-GCK]ADU00963.1 trehalose 6-phosphatase [Mycolicibacterium gilvum Spyr1]MBV5242516.1 trehalose-phosphatase [Mycolicibacterium sp. PAM1]